MVILSNDDKFKKEITKNPIIKSEKIDYDRTFETTIRPKNFENYIGQSALKETLQVSIDAAKKRNVPLDHMLFYGSPGLGKTTLAGVVAEQMGAEIKITSAPALERPRDIIGVLMSLKGNEVLFIDEIHRLNKVTEEILYSAMEDFCLDMTTGKTQTAKTMRIALPKFTLIGATTKAGELSGPLRDRFGIVHRLEFYTKEELTQVIKRTANILKIDITDEGAEAIAKCSRGTPRIANRLVKRVSDFAIVKYDSVITKEVAENSLKAMKIDELGLDSTDKAFLNMIIQKFDGGPVGIETISAALGEDVRTLEDVCEPYLLQLGFINRTPRGRKATPEAFRHLNIKIDKIQKTLFED